MKKKNITGLSKAEIAVIKEAFDLYDVDHTGSTKTAVCSLPKLLTLTVLSPPTPP